MPARYKPYPKYKPSGVEWLGDEPVNWRVKRVKHLAQVYNGNSLNEAQKQQYESENYDDLPYISSKDIDSARYSINYCNGLSIPRSETSYKVAPTHSSLLCIEGGSAGRKVAFTSQDVCFVNKLACFNVDKESCSKYMFYTINATPFQVQFNNSMSGLIGGVSLSAICNFNMLVPPAPEQRAIAAFLDRETGKLDELIARQQELIELLEEKRQAVISHAVTKGLNPDASMKPSGIEWLGDIPEHWVLKPMKYLCSFSGGGTPSKENLKYWLNGSIPWVSPKDMKTFWLSDTQDKITERAVVESSTNLIDSGALLMVVRSGILQRMIPIAINEVAVTLNQDMKALRFNSRMEPTYAANFIQGHQSPLLLEWGKQGATVESIEHEYLANSHMPVPPLDEQQQIADYLHQQTAKIDKLINKAKAAIELMRERRTALISAAVTGKIDVREETLHAGIQVKEHKASIPFQRSVLAAEIAERMYPQITFGRVKFQKALALCEMHLGMDLDGHYKRDAAGPFDNRMMRSVSKQLQDQQWFQEVKREGGKGWQYEPMEKHGGHRKYFERYWGNKQDEFDNLIHLLSRMDSRQAEIVATLYSAWRDFLAEGKQPTDNELVTEVRTNWHDSKKAIEPETWHKAIDWMRKEGLVPDSKQG